MCCNFSFTAALFTAGTWADRNVPVGGIFRRPDAAQLFFSFYLLSEVKTSDPAGRADCAQFSECKSNENRGNFGQLEKDCDVERPRLTDALAAGSFYADGIPAVKAHVSTIPLIRETHKRLTINQKPLGCCAVRPQWMTLRSLRARLQKFDYRPTGWREKCNKKQTKNRQITPSVTHVHTMATCFF